MILKNSMEDKQLNFNQPLLSVRRGSSTTAAPECNKRRINNCSPNLPSLPYYTSDLKSGPVRNPGVVPFQWEKTPGKPKDESEEQRDTPPEQLPLAPKLPPGRFASNKQKSTDKFPKDSPSSSFRSMGDNNSASSPEISSINKVLSELEVENKGNDNDNEATSSSEDENVTYQDARDTLFRRESFFLNCSFRGVSGLDGSSEDSSGSFLDPKIRDFMMGRFLPAAKAVASEMPQFACKKLHPVAREQPELIKKMVTNKGSPIHYDVHNVSFHNIHGEGGDEEEEDDEGGDYEGHGHEDMSVRLCGLLPSFCLLNPIPGMRDHARIIPQVRSTERTKPMASGARVQNRIGNHRGDLTRIAWRNGHTNKSKERSSHAFRGREREFLGLPEDFRVKVDIQRKGFTRLKELLAEDVGEGITKLANPIIERTLYIDSEEKAESRNSNSSSSESRGRTPSVDDSLQDVHSHCGGADEKAVFSQVEPKSSEKPSQDVGQDLVVEYLQKDKEFSLIVKETTKENSPTLAFATLLPKSPSESWLSRTLPAMSSKNPTSKMYFGNPNFKPPPVDSKMGRTIRTSNGHLLCQPPTELAPILET